MFRGFTLIELMTVLAIVAILAAISYPAYTEQVRKARRADAQGVLLEASQFLERFYTENNRYDRNVVGVAVALPAFLTESPKEGTTKYYDITLTASAQAYTLTAVPKNIQAGDRCGNMTITNTGNKGASGTDCWRR
ncbi:MAG: type IVa pilus pseudopilin TppA [Tibeticola sp.]